MTGLALTCSPLRLSNINKLFIVYRQVGYRQSIRNHLSRDANARLPSLLAPALASERASRRGLIYKPLTGCAVRLIGRSDRANHYRVGRASRATAILSVARTGSLHI